MHDTLYENVAAQELAAQHMPLYYFMASKQDEVDFIADGNDGNPIPIEVKSGRHYRSHAAIDSLLVNPEYRIPSGVVLSRGNPTCELASATRAACVLLHNQGLFSPPMDAYLHNRGTLTMRHPVLNRLNYELNRFKTDFSGANGS